MMEPTSIARSFYISPKYHLRHAHYKCHMRPKLQPRKSQFEITLLREKKRQTGFRVAPSTNALSMCSRKPAQAIKAHVIQYFFDINKFAPKVEPCLKLSILSETQLKPFTPPHREYKRETRGGSTLKVHASSLFARKRANRKQKDGRIAHEPTAHLCSETFSDT